jgi:NADH-quinone oxidoreductase subunit C
MIDVSEILGDLLLEKKVKNGDEYFLVERSNLLPAMIRLEKEFSFFSECVGVDYSTWTHERDFPERFEVVYNLMSPKTAQRIFVKTAVDDGQSIPSMVPVYQGAEYPEKEIADLFGIHFEGNELAPGTRFILPDDWTGFPLRKEYPLGGEDVLFDKSSRGPAIEDKMVPHAGESFEGNTGTDKVSGR